MADVSQWRSADFLPLPDAMREYPKGEGVFDLGETLEGEPGANTPPCRLRRTPPRLRREGGKNDVTAHFIEREILVVSSRGAAILLNFAEPDFTVEGLFEDFPELLQPNVILEREVYAHFGLLYMGFALLEHSMINVVTIKQNITTLKKYPRPNAALWESHFDGSFAYAAAQTFGNLSKVVTAIPEFKDLGEGLLKVKKIRDYFSHHFFRREVAHMSEQQSALELLVDINRARLLVKMVEMEMTPRYSQYLKRLGLPVLSESAIDEGAEKLSQNEREKLASGTLPRGVARWLNRGQED